MRYSGLNILQRASSQCSVSLEAQSHARPSACIGRARLCYENTRHVRVKAFEIEDHTTNDTTQSAPKVTVPVVTVDMVKATLHDAICDTERGLVARSEARAEINELINQLEVKGGQRADVSSADFGGTWELLYSNATELVALMAVSKLPLSLIKIGAIKQTINVETSTVENSVQLEFPLVQTSISTISTYDIASPKRLQFSVQRGILYMPSIESNVQLPTSVSLMGQQLDLTPLKDVLAPLTRGAANLALSASDLLSQAPNLEVPLQNQFSWQLTTYLDNSLRIARGDGGAVYIFRKGAANTH